MSLDPFRLAIALVPIAAYLLLLGMINVRRKPFLTWGGSDLVVLGLALSGLVFVGPLELFRPEAATTQFGNYVWLFLLVFYWLGLLLAVLLARPRLVIYNIRIDELHPVLAEVASRLDPSARWGGNNLTLPGLGIELHLDSLDIMRNVSLVSSGGRQSLEGWQRLAQELAISLRSVQVKPNPRAVSLFLLSLLSLGGTLMHMLAYPLELALAMREVFQF